MKSKSKHLKQKQIKSNDNKPTIVVENSEKINAELLYWQTRKSVEGELTNNNKHYVNFYTNYFNLDFNYYKNKKILDIGCGPRGSLEWADMAKERIGLDPIADLYLKLEASKHKMKYIKAGCENIPFSNNHFDIICSFNSLDHVDNLEKSILEIIRVLKSDGIFLLITDVNHKPTSCEPIYFSFDVVNKFMPQFSLLSKNHYEKKAGGTYQSILQNIPYDEKNESDRYGILTAKFQKK
ncbi:MAG: hypothetical protein A2046_03730 [Bacteroidetes bacterium GWA2_30_7]|nr:MAG: hypothetical protein A2046_03730 [Bacteroidetes bacterium GWA2_30_7]